MKNNDATLILLIALTIFGIVAIGLIAGHYVHGQEITTVATEDTGTETTPSQPNNNVPPEAVTGVGIAGAGAAIALAKQFLDQRTNKNRDKTTDKDTGRFIILMSKFYQAKYLYPEKTDKEILDLPISNNPMSKITIGQAITAEADLWADGNQAYWNIPKPNMSIPTATTVNAVKSSTAAPPTQPPPPGNVQQQSEAQQQAPSSTETTD